MIPGSASGMANGRIVALMQQLRRVSVTSTVGLSDGQLLERFVAAGDEAAFELLLRRHERMVMGLLQRMLRDPHTVDDAFQATFLAFVRKARSIADAGSVGGWLYRVAYHA